MDTTLKYTGQVMNFFSRKEVDNKKRRNLFSGLFDDEQEQQQPTINTSRERRSVSNASADSKHLDQQALASPTSIRDNTTSIIGESEINFDVNDLDITNDDFEELISDLDGIDLNEFVQDELVQKAIQDGVDLREYSKHIEDDLRKIETQSIDDYLEESERLADLHIQLQQCDNVLEKMENMLQNFQGSLGNISEEIKTLRDQSFTMNIKKRNRETAQQKLSTFVDKIVIPPELTKRVCDDNVTDSYLEHLLTLDEKKDYIDSIQSQVKRPIKACDDVLPILDKLCTKSVSKVRSYLLQQLNELKKPKTNTQFIKQLLLKKKYYFDFVSKHSPQTGEELISIYDDIIGRYYFNSFKTYLVSLLKLEQKVGTRQSLIIEPTQSLLNNITNMTVMNPLSYTTNMLGLGNKSSNNGDAIKDMNRSVFTLGERLNVLENATDLNSPLVVRVLIEQSKKLYMEEIFRSVHILLINTATSEYIFTLDFFNNEQMFESIFSKSLQLLKDTWTQFITNSFDCIGIMLMIRLNYLFSSLMEKRNMKVLDSYFDQVHAILTPKLFELFELNLNSIRESKIDQLISKEKDSHTLAKRFAEFSCSIHLLNKENPTKFKQQIEEQLLTCRDLILKQLNLISDKIFTTKTKKKQIFLINSYDLIVHQFMQSKIEVSDGLFIQKLLVKQVDQYIESELSECYGGMIHFIQSTEPKLSSTFSSSNSNLNSGANTSSGNNGELIDSNKNFVQNRAKVDCAEMENIAKDFDKNWKQGISHINSNVLQNFSNFNTGKEILQKAFSQLVLYYTRFTKIVSLCYGDNPPFRSSIIATQKILYEFKKYIQDFN